MRSNSKNRPLAIAHRGAKNKFPENTLQAIQYAIGLGVDAVEFDVDVSQDGKAVLIHQESMRPSMDFKRLEQVPTDTDLDWVREFTLEELMQLDAGSWFSKEFAGTPLCKLEELLSLNWQDCGVFLELKEPSFYSSTPSPQRAGAIVDSVLPILHALKSKVSLVCCISFSPFALEALKKREPAVERLLAIGDLEGPELSNAISLSEPSGFIVSMAHFLKDDKIRSSGPVFVYESSSRNRENAGIDGALPSNLSDDWKDSLLLGARGIISDYPDALIDFLGSDAT